MLISLTEFGCFCPAGEKSREKEKDKHSSTSSVSSKGSGSSVGTVTSSTVCNGTSHGQNAIKQEKTWVHEMFEGTLTNETRCLCCEAVSQVNTR